MRKRRRGVGLECQNCRTEEGVVQCAECTPPAIVVLCSGCDAEIHSMRVLQDHKRISATMICANCEIDVAKFRCQICSAMLCNKCDQFVHSQRIFRSHPRDAASVLGVLEIHPKITQSFEFDEVATSNALGLPGAPFLRRPTRGRPKRDKDAPRGPISTFMAYCKERYDEVRSANPTMSFGQIGKTLGREWRSKTAEELKRYEAVAAADKERYQREMELYKQAQSDNRKRQEQQNMALFNMPAVQQLRRETLQSKRAAVTQPADATSYLQQTMMPDVYYVNELFNPIPIHPGLGSEDFLQYTIPQMVPGIPMQPVQTIPGSMLELEDPRERLQHQREEAARLQAMEPI